MKRLMHILAKLFPDTAMGENPVAVKMFYKISNIKEFFIRAKRSTKSQWPPFSGNYQVVNPNGQIAICTLTSENFTSQALTWQNVAIVGKIYTPNLGIEKIIQNIITNPNIRYLVLCGKDSPVFHPGQAIQCLFLYGTNAEKRIKNAIGHFPFLKNLSDDKINVFLRQIELIDCIEEKEAEVILQKITALEMKKIRFNEKEMLKTEIPGEEEMFIPLKPGGKRIPLDYDKNGFLVITTDDSKREIVVRHYYKGNHPGHIIKGHSSESIILAILEKGLISQMSHASYLGAELAKAETALKLDLSYEQDRPLRK